MAWTDMFFDPDTTTPVRTASPPVAASPKSIPASSEQDEKIYTALSEATFHRAGAFSSFRAMLVNLRTALAGQPEDVITKAALAASQCTSADLLKSLAVHSQDLQSEVTKFNREMENERRAVADKQTQLESARQRIEVKKKELEEATAQAETLEREHQEKQESAESMVTQFERAVERVKSDLNNYESNIKGGVSS